jgi:uncharacterized membrane protein
MVTLTSRASKWLALALTISVAANLFFGGVYLAHWFGPHGYWFRMMHGSESGPSRGVDRSLPMLDRMASRLPPGDRAKFEAIIKEHRPALSSFGDTIRDSRRKLRDQLIADKIDRDAIIGTMTEVRERSLAFQSAMQSAILEAAEGLSPEARRQIMGRGGRDRDRDRDRRSGP